MGGITRLPGQGCQYHLGGHCLYEERLNPGYTQGWRCRVLSRWESAFDDFLARAESFGIKSDVAPDLWGRQFERMARDVFDCEQYVCCQAEGIPACLHESDGLCILMLPECSGRCCHYEVEEKQSSNG
ncbi:MAG: hypothetical protein JEY79_01660 [Pseudodesulfovibrio sp.]|nr:hypothetical protein [Pseudodesulfovibrio sp.]